MEEVLKLLYGKLGEKNFDGVIACIARFCNVVSTSTLGHRDAAMLRVCCDAQDNQIYNIEVSLFVGDRLNAGCCLAVNIVNQAMTQATLSLLGRHISLGKAKHDILRAKQTLISYGDFVGFSSDNNVLLVCNNSENKIDFFIKLRLRDIYTLRLNNITERISNCLLDLNDTLHPRLDKKWIWTKKLICLASLECLLRALNLWDNIDIRDECRNEAVIKLMIGDLLFDGIAGLDEYNMYSNDAKQRVEDSDLLITCGKWLASGGTDVARSLRANDISEKSVYPWKILLESDLGIVLPALTKHGEMRKGRMQKEVVAV